MKKIRKDKDGWYWFGIGAASISFINDDCPNILCTRLKVPGVLYPHEVRSGKLIDNGETFQFDGEIDLGGFVAREFYKDKTAIKKLFKKKKAAYIERLLKKKKVA